MQLDKFTIKAQEAIQYAQSFAIENKNQQIENSHLLKALFKVDEVVLSFIFNKLGANKNLVIQNIDKELNSLTKSDATQQYLSRDANQTLLNADRQAKKMGDEFITIEHLFLALLQAKEKTAQILKDAGCTLSQTKKAIDELRKGEKIKSQSAEDNYNSLERYAQNLNEKASSGKLDPVIGRDAEIRRVLQILARRTKNNPMLVGEPGVGKTAIAEGLAYRIVNGDAPEDLLQKKIYSLDMGALVAGAKYKGEFEERLKSVVKDVTKSDGNIVLFIDEIHTLVGAGGGEGAMDAANILKPALARGELRAVGATTLDEYQKYIEKDKALERRFQKVVIDEPTEEDAISILRGLKERYENYHKIRIKDEAVIAAVQLSTRYISDRFLPDKAIDLIDEAAAVLRMETNSKPEEIDNLDRKIQQLSIEKEAFKREKDKAREEFVSKQISELKEQRNHFAAIWKEERAVVQTIQSAKQEIENLKIQAERMEREGLLAEVAEIRYAKIPQLETDLEESISKLNDYEKQGKRMLREEVTSEDIAEVVSKWSGVPVTRMLESEKSKLLKIEEELANRVVGQKEAIQSIASAIRRSRTGLADEKKPIGSFLFLGTTGVGKTELARALSEYLFNDENALTRIDMSEYQEKHSVSRLVGAPPGYIGYDEGGQLTEAVRRKPYSVILLDEIEKAHPDSFNILLQVLEDGRLTDNKGRLADFKNSLIIMTSNLGSEIISSAYDSYHSTDFNEKLNKSKAQVQELLKRNLRPEFLNRIDEKIIFDALGKEEIGSIINIQLNGFRKVLAKQNINFEIDHSAMEYLKEEGFDLHFGARPLKRLIQKELLDKVSIALLEDRVQPNSTIEISYQEGEIVVK